MMKEKLIKNTRAEQI